MLKGLHHGLVTAELLVNDNPVTVIAAGPLSKQRGTMAYRVVLCWHEPRQEFVVWNQQFPRYTIDNPDCSNSNASEGSYFKVDELRYATECFAERVGKHARYLESLNSDQVA